MSSKGNFEWGSRCHNVLELLWRKSTKSLACLSILSKQTYLLLSILLLCSWASPKLCGPGERMDCPDRGAFSP